MKNLIYICLVALIGVAISSCNPSVEEGIELPNPPSATFSWEFVSGDENRVVVTSGTEGDGFMHFWDFGNGLTSNELTDTIFYPVMGDYTISYSVFNAGGSGTDEQTISIAQTVEIPCSGTLELLTGCDNQKTWIFSQEEAAIGVGPAPYDISWFTSGAGDLVECQYDDSYQFTSDGGFVYGNSGGTVDPWDGYQCLPYESTVANYIFSEGTGTSGEDQILLPTCSFIGTKDSGPSYDIIELTETTLVLHAPIQDASCAQAAEGFFTYKFVVQ